MKLNSLLNLTSKKSSTYLRMWLTKRGKQAKKLILKANKTAAGGHDISENRRYQKLQLKWSAFKSGRLMMVCLPWICLRCYYTSLGGNHPLILPTTDSKSTLASKRTESDCLVSWKGNSLQHLHMPSALRAFKHTLFWMKTPCKIDVNNLLHIRFSDAILSS